MTLAAASSNDKDAAAKYGGNVATATAVGTALAAKAVAKGITKAAFDRRGVPVSRADQGPGPRGDAGRAGLHRADG